MSEASTAARVPGGPVVRAFHSSGQPGPAAATLRVAQNQEGGPSREMERAGLFLARGQVVTRGVVLPLRATPPAVHETQAPRRLRFDREGAAGVQLTLAAVGDLLLHGNVQRDAQNAVDRSIEDPDARGASGYAKLFEAVAHDLAKADLTVGNLEVPLARDLAYRGRRKTTPPYEYFDNDVYKSHENGVPVLNAHPSFAKALKNLGFDAVVTANNHALDRGSEGINRTLEALAAAGLPQVGLVRADELEQGKFPQSKRHIILEAKGVRIALLSYTGVHNAGPSPQLSSLGPDGAFLADIRRMRSQADVDLVVVAPHWGDDRYPTMAQKEAAKPNLAQRRWAREMAEAGADVILGTHPHLLQPLERIVTGKGDAQRETLVVYSLGNFIANQGQPDYKDHGKYVHYRSTAIVYVHITKPREGGKAFVRAVSYLPVEINKRRPVAIACSTGNEAERAAVTESLGYPDNVIAPARPCPAVGSQAR